MTTEPTEYLKERITEAYSDRSLLDGANYRAAVEEVIKRLDEGSLRVAEPNGEQWVTHEWLKQAILLTFSTRIMQVQEVGMFQYHDKMPLKRDYDKLGVRVVPPAVARYGAYLGQGVIMMPSYVNIGAWVGAGTMVDTWATVGSCAQVGAGVHLSGGVGIGGVLEPLQASPVIIEDGAFIGSRCIVVEGVRVGSEAVLGAGVVLTSSTKIIDVTGATPRELRGYVPPRSVVIPGTIPKVFPSGTYQVPAALIIGMRSESTDKKTSLTEALREFQVAV